MNYDQIVKKILEDYNLGKIKNIQKLDTSGNVAFKIITSNNSYFLRLSPKELFRSRSRQELLAEVEFLAYLYKNRLPVLLPIDNKIISFDGMNGYIRKFDSGVALKNPTTKQVKTFGRILGKMHKVSQGYKTKHKRDHIWDLSSTKSNLAEDKTIIENGFVGGREFFEKFHKSLFAISDPRPSPKGMVHEDLGKRHVLWHSNQISAIIDFDRCYYGYLVDDLGQSVRGWCFNESGDFIKENYVAILKSYKQEREPTKDEMIALPYSIKFAFLERSLSFILRGIYKKDKNLINYAKQLLKIADKTDYF